MDLSKLSIEELLELKSKFAGEVSKKTCSDSIGKSKVQDLNPAPIKNEKDSVLKENKWRLMTDYLII